MLRNLKTGDVIWSGTSSKTSAVEQRSISGIVAVMSRDLSEATGATCRLLAKRAFPARFLWQFDWRKLKCLKAKLSNNGQALGGD